MDRGFRPGRIFYIALIVGGGTGSLVGIITELPAGLSVGLGTGIGAIVGIRLQRLFAGAKPHRSYVTRPSRALTAHTSKEGLVYAFDSYGHLSAAYRSRSDGGTSDG